MPKKKKGKGKGKKGKGKKGKLKAAAEKEEMVKKTKTALKTYHSYCTNVGCSSGAIVINSLKQCVEDEKPLIKAVLDPQRAVAERKQNKNRKDASKETLSGTELQDGSPPVKVSPLFKALSEMDYLYLRCIHVWQLQLDESEAVELSRFMESKIGYEIRVLELIKNDISTWSLFRLCRTFPMNRLVHITLDYNRMDDASVQCLCTNLIGNLHLNSLNLNYCNISSSCGASIGTLASSTQLRYLSLRGNQLRAKGVRLLVQNLASISEAKENMPLLGRLFLQDNEIDGCGFGEEGIFAPVSCMETMKRWLMKCKIIEEVRLDGNLIGDSAGREILQGLKSRKEAGYSPVQLSVTSSINAELFLEIQSLSASKKTKKGKAKKKGKKKK